MYPGLISGIKRSAQAADVHVDLHIPFTPTFSPWIAITRYVSVDYIKGAEMVSSRRVGTEMHLFISLYTTQTP